MESRFRLTNLRVPSIFSPYVDALQNLFFIKNFLVNYKFGKVKKDNDKIKHLYFTWAYEALYSKNKDKNTTKKGKNIKKDTEKKNTKEEYKDENSVTTRTLR